MKGCNSDVQNCHERIISLSHTFLTCLCNPYFSSPVLLLIATVRHYLIFLFCVFLYFKKSDYIV